MNETCITELKATRLQSSLPLTPQQIAEAEMASVRSAIGSFYTDTQQNEDDLSQEVEDKDEEQSEDSLKDVKRTNPKVGRAIGPKRKSGS